ncbi:MAG: MAPEG family protein [Candidatus Binatia bacterium]
MTFTVARVLHTRFYAFGLQPWRTIVFEIANLALAATAILLLLKLI